MAAHGTRTFRILVDRCRPAEFDIDGVLVSADLLRVLLGVFVLERSSVETELDGDAPAAVIISHGSGKRGCLAETSEPT